MIELARFLRATIEGFRQNEQDPELGATLAVQRYGRDLGLDLREQVAENKLQIPLMKSSETQANGPFWMSTDRIVNQIYPGLRAAGNRDLPPISRILDMSVLGEALK